MRIRRRPPLPLSPSQNSNLVSPQTQPPRNYAREEQEIRGLHQVGDLSIDPHLKQGFNEEKDSFPPPSSSYNKALDAQVHNNESIGEEEITTNGSSNVVAIDQEVINNGNKKRRSPAVLMEGSRCSRVNGRGWRCSQQTLIGYSLCEHHLGKGRIRNIESVARKPRRKASRGKIGVVKARSMSSLLDEDEDGSNVQLV